MASLSHNGPRPQLRNVQRQHFCSLKHSPRPPAPVNSSGPLSGPRIQQQTSLSAILQPPTQAQSTIQARTPPSRRNLTTPIPANKLARPPTWAFSRRRATTRTRHALRSSAPAKRTKPPPLLRTPTLLPQRTETPTPTHPPRTRAADRTNIGARSPPL